MASYDFLLSPWNAYKSHPRTWGQVPFFKGDIALKQPNICMDPMRCPATWDFFCLLAKTGGNLAFLAEPKGVLICEHIIPQSCFLREIEDPSPLQKRKFLWEAMKTLAELGLVSPDAHTSKTCLTTAALHFWAFSKTSPLNLDTHRLTKKYPIMIRSST
jgi:hypothetical protein